MQEKLGSLRQN